MHPYQPIRNTKLSSLRAWRTVSAAILLCLAAAIAAHGQTFRVLANFNGPVTGEHPQAPLVQGLDGNLYGTAFGGGPYKCSCGTVFRVTPTGALTPVHWFNGSDGIQVSNGLILDPTGDLYGAANGGGAYGDGTVFLITAQGTLRTLHNFTGADGIHPSGLVLGRNLKLYGTTESGGVNGAGTVFSITWKGALTTIYNFCSQAPDCADGETPQWPLVQSGNGNFYGVTTMGGGFTPPIYAAGTLFQITAAGNLTTIFSFTNTPSATTKPASGLLLASNGNFYLDEAANSNVGDGSVDGIGSNPGYIGSYMFSGSDGGDPVGGLIEGSDGNLYGVTQSGGEFGEGTIFQITRQGVLTTLHSFNGNGTEGYQPAGGLVQGTDGVFYGTTTTGPAYQGAGTVYSLSMGLAPFVKTLPTSGPAGRCIKILGTNLTGATSVTFNGTAAAFTIISPTEIQTNVPADAKTGKVKVVTPRGTLSSNVPFQVF
jgi:uncharacterized repeat protein (TIGR03803 family)